DDSLRPVTIKQLIECKEAYPGADLAVDGVPTTQVTLVGQVRSVNPQAVNVTYRIDDGTGVIDVKKWIDADKADNTPRFAPDTYVRVFGRLSSFNGRKHVGAHYIRAIDDFNEVNYHLLEATYVHLCLTKGGLADLQQQQQQQQQQQVGDDGGDSMFVDGGYGAGGGISSDGPPRLSVCSRNARTMYNYLVNTPGDSQHINQISAGTGLPVRDVLAASAELLDNGLIYTTDDDVTWAVME
ncbi:uncharacterized protein THITE_2047529, partial [Thermothielavioides terrestris NRRL 8126]